ncbi:MAG: tetratricopeptide repeat protein [Myxococcales bacterium]|nr:tetratricopeptide repeat protein [Myxococcales bacterium]
MTGGRSVLCLTLLVVTGSCSRSTSVDVGFAPLSPDAAEQQRLLEQDAAEAARYAPHPSTDAVIEAYLRFNRLTGKRGSDPNEIDQAFERLRRTVIFLIQDGDGMDRLRRLQLQLLSQFEKALAQVLTLSDGEARAALFQGTPPPESAREVIERFRELGGDFLDAARLNGLLRVDGDRLTLAPDGAFFVRLAFKVRFANLAPEAIGPLDWLLSESERLWYHRWVLTRSQTADLTRKLNSIEYLKAHDPSFNKERALGIVLYQQRDYAAAARAFEKALEKSPSDEELTRFRDAAKSRM